MLVVLLLPFLVAAEWVEITQNNNRKDPFEETKIFEDTTKANKLYNNNSLSQRQWSKGYVQRVSTTGNIERRQGTERTPVVNQRNPFLRDDMSVTEKPGRRFNTNKPKLTNNFRTHERKENQDKNSHEKLQKPGHRFDTNNPNATNTLRSKEKYENKDQNFHEQWHKAEHQFDINNPKLTNTFRINDRNENTDSSVNEQRQKPVRRFNTNNSTPTNTFRTNERNRQKTETRFDTNHTKRNDNSEKGLQRQRQRVRPISSTGLRENHENKHTNQFVLKDTMNKNSGSSGNPNLERVINSDENYFKKNESPSIPKTVIHIENQKDNIDNVSKIRIEEEKTTTISNIYEKDFTKKDDLKNISKQSKTSNKSKNNSMEALLRFLKVVTQTINQSTRRSLNGKVRYLEDLKETLLASIENRIDLVFPDDDGTQQRRRRATETEPRGHVEFPSSESALMTISFLTFAVFLIKLVLQVIHTYKAKTMMVTPAVVATVGRATAAVFRNPFHHSQN